MASEPGQVENPYSPGRALVMRTILKLCRGLESGQWHTKRGGVVWANWDWGSHPFGIAVFADEGSFLREEKNELTVTLEIMTQLPANNDEIDDDLMDRLWGLAAEVFYKLDKERNPDDSGMPVVTRIDTTRDTALEVSSADDRVQGLIATAFVEY